MQVLNYARKSRFFCSCDLDLDPDQMTLTYELGLGILKMYPHTKNEDSRSRLSRVRARTVHTRRDTHILTDASESITIRFVGGNKKYRKQSKQDFLCHDWLTLTYDPMTFQR